MRNASIATKVTRQDKSEMLDYWGELSSHWIVATWQQSGDQRIFIK